MDGIADEALVALAQQGQEAAFTELMRRTHTSSYKLALSILRDAQDAKDEVQNAYWKAWQHMGQFQQDAKFSTWLTRIVVNQCLMKLRQGRRAQFTYIDNAQIGEDTGTLDLRDRAASPEIQYGRREVEALLHREIGRIPPLLRNVFILREVNELPLPEVAERLGISVAAAKSRLLRARAALRERLEKHTGRRGLASLTATQASQV